MLRNRGLVNLVFLTFFVMSLLTNILGAIVPDIITAFHVNLAAAGVLAFAFFIAYGVTSIPAGFLVQRFGEKPVMIAAFLASLIGSFAFAMAPHYVIAIASLFVIGAGMATLQVAINPLLRVAGGEEHFAFNSVVAQLVFGSASFLSPLLYSFLVLHLNNSNGTYGILALLHRITPVQLPWLSLYWIFAVAATMMIAVVAAFPFPKVVYTSEERPGTIEVYRELASRPIVWLYFIAIFAYVGSEQGTADWISRFLAQYHGFDPHTSGAEAVSWFWGLLTIGCIVGLVLVKHFDSRHVLIGASTLTLIRRLWSTSRAHVALRECRIHPKCRLLGPTTHR